MYAWLDTLALLTKRNYLSGLKRLIEYGLINPLKTLQDFALANHQSIIDQIKLIKGWSECSRQARAACYISFTGYLNRRLQGMIKKALPNKEKESKTFFKVYEKVKTKATNHAQWQSFLQALAKINKRDCLIAKITLQGGKRIGEVLSLQTENIDWSINEITFKQSKTKGYIKETVITYPDSVMKSLKEYIGERVGDIFVTRSNNKVSLRQVAKTFAKTGLAANLPFKITPHVLRASTVTYLKGQGFADGDIMKVTGHASAELIYAYDKSSRSENASKHVSLVS
ncbi:MAG: tyrosine-type recombinase/integrase [Parachlamydiaceae bacterium]